MGIGSGVVDGTAVPTDEVRARISAALAEAVGRLSDPTPAVTAATRARRRARARELDEIAATIDRRGHARTGHRSATSWLAQATGESIGHCKATVTVVSRLPHLPLVGAAFRDGELAESALRALAEAWSADIADVFAESEQMLLDWAMRLPFSDFTALLEVWLAHADHDRLEQHAADQYERRELHLSQMLDGVGKLDGILDPEGLSLVREALRSLSAPAHDDRRTAAQRRADALVDMARLTLDQVETRRQMDAADGPDTLFGPATPARRARRNRPRVLATIGYDELVAGRGAGVIDTNLDHHAVPAETIRRLACDAGVHRYVTGPLGIVIDHGRQHRVVSDPQFDRLHLRDHGCRWPGCHVPAAGCDAHHARHWLDGGTTTDDNLVLLCWHHHHTVHDQHWSIEPLGAGHFIVTDPTGRTLLMRPPSVGPAPPSAA